MHLLTEYDSTGRNALAKVDFAVIKPMFLGLARAVGVATATYIVLYCTYID